MTRDLGKEIDELRQQMERLREEITPQLDKLQTMIKDSLPNKATTEKPNRVHVMREMHPDKRLGEQMEELCRKTDEENVSGLVTYLGVYNSGGRQSNWIRNGVSTDALLSLIESGVAEKILVCIGNQNRLEILSEILREPKTVTALVEKCGFGSTGQVYHHLKPLLAADIVVETEKQKGLYVINPKKVQRIIMLLAGISDLVDETLTRESQEAPENEEI